MEDGNVRMSSEEETSTPRGQRGDNEGLLKDARKNKRRQDQEDSEKRNPNYRKERKSVEPENSTNHGKPDTHRQGSVLVGTPRTETRKKEKNQEDLEAVEDMQIFIQFQTLKPTTFNGVGGPQVAEYFLNMMEALFERVRLSPTRKVQVASSNLLEAAELWWTYGC